MPVKTRYASASYGYMRYPPSILLVAERTVQALKLKQILECKGCQVCWTNSEGLNSVSRAYFELIILDIDQASENALARYQKLKNYPELAHILIVILTPHQSLEQTIDEFEQEPVYFLPKDSSTGLRLWSIIDEVHYLIHRYGLP